MNEVENTSKTKSKGLKHVFQPIYCFSRSAGLWPFTVTYDSNGSIEETRVHLFDIIWFLMSVCFYLTGLFFAFDKVKKVKTSIMLFSIHIPSLLFGPVCIVLDMFNRKRLVNILDDFIAFDREVSVDVDPFPNFHKEM